MNKSSHLLIFLIIFFAITNCNLFAQKQWNDITSGTEIFKDSRSISINSNGSVVAIGSPSVHSRTGGEEGQVIIYSFDGIRWQQKGNQINGDNDECYLGKGVKLNSSGNIVAVCANGYWTANDPNYIRVYEYQDSLWEQLGQDLENNTNDYYTSIDINSEGSVVAIGIPMQQSNSNIFGKVSIHEYKNNIWQQKGSDIYGPDLDAFFGSKVSIDSTGNIIAISAPISNSVSKNNIGKVFVFKFDGTDWVQHGNTIIGESDSMRLGKSMSLSKNGLRLAIGAVDVSDKDRRGIIRIFEYLNDQWEQIGNSIFITKETYSCVTLNTDGSVLAASIPYYSEIELFKYFNETNEWSLIGETIISNIEVGAFGFGYQMALNSSGDILATTSKTKTRVYQYGYEYNTNSIEDLSQDNSIQIYPNPNYGELILTLPGATSENSTIRLYNIMGELIMTSKYKHKLDVSGVDEGVYILRLNYPGGNIIRKLMFQR